MLEKLEYISKVSWCIVRILACIAALFLIFSFVQADYEANEIQKQILEQRFLTNL